jgi:hypothetical protein
VDHQVDRLPGQAEMGSGALGDVSGVEIDSGEDEITNQFGLLHVRTRERLRSKT